jgi:predicted transcriptional regulator
LSTKLERLLNSLSDNVWHSTSEVAEILQIPQDRLQQVIALLTETDLIQHNSSTNQIKLDQNWTTLIIDQKETNEVK